MMYNGFNVVVVPNVIEVNRTVTERLFSWPWRPRLKKKWIPNPAARGDEILKIGKTIYVSPKINEIIKLNIQEQGRNV